MITTLTTPSSNTSVPARTSSSIILNVNDDLAKQRAALKERLVLALRVMHKLGFEYHYSARMSARDPGDPNMFWVHPQGLSFRVVVPSELILVDAEGNYLAGGGDRSRAINVLGCKVDYPVFTARPDITAICHVHSTYGMAFSALGRQLDMITQESAVFFESHSLYAGGDEGISKSQEGHEVAETLGKGKAIIQHNHGLMTVGASIDSALAWAILLDKECHVQLLTLSVGIPTIKLSTHDCNKAKPFGTEEEGIKKVSVYFHDVEADYYSEGSRRCLT